MDGGTVTLRLLLQWDLRLDPQNERRPFAHLFLSTLYALQVHQVELEQAKGQMKLSLTFSSETLRKVTPEDLVANCDLNIHLFARTFNNYEEAVQNPAGNIIVALHELVHTERTGSDKAVEKTVGLFMVSEPELNQKGLMRIQHAGTGIPMIQLRDTPITNKHYVKALVQRSITRVQKIQAILSSYIQTTERLYERVRPTIRQVRNINSVIWNSSAMDYMPIAYTLDVVQPVITEAFFNNCLDIVLDRNKLTAENVRRWRITGENPSKSDVIQMENICGQLLCAFVIHCSYRADFVYVYHSDSKTFEKRMVENFGDLMVDLTGDCEVSNLVNESYC
jgi:DNA-binding transcriptional regulator YdaS (Cro superfamily)